MKNQLLKFLLITILLASHVSVKAEDIDLFVGTPPSAADVPNVLIVLDNTANWTSAFTNEMAALASVVNGLPADKFRLGLMLFSETGAGNSGNDGAYVRAAIRTMNSANKTKYQNLVNSLNVTADKSNGGKIAKSMEEAYLYFSAGVPHAGNNKDKTDYTGNASGLPASNAVYALANNALLSKAGSPYVNPIVGSCVKNYVIYISNGAAQDNNSDTTQATTALTAVGGNTTAIPISPSGSQSNVADEWSRFMKKSPLSITTYTVDINKVTTGQGPGWTALLKSVAGVSSGKYFDVTSSGSQIADALNGIFSEIQSVDSVFSSVSLPVSVNTQGLFLNQVYIGMFRPDPDSFPRWQGNLKQYKLGFSGDVLQLLDADNVPAINAQKGFITECARSFWTGTVLDSYWSFSPKGNCLLANSDVSNYPDGNIVEKGAQAFKLRSITPASRIVKTCSPTSCSTLTNFNNTNVTQAMLGAANTTERDNLINWQIGQDLKDENINAVTTTEMRPSAHGDVVHSRPVAINYGTDAAPSVVVFYGGNDGMLRAINGNRTANIGSTTAGSELWSFVAPEFYPKIKRIYDNTNIISFPGQTIPSPPPAVLPSPKDYGVDGSIVAYKDASSAWVFASLRRGGRALYAMDVTSPASPTLKWKVGCPNQSNDTGCSSGISGIGQTWSAPQIAKAAGYGSGTSPLLIMGGGYDTCHDADPNTSCSSSSKGTKIYVLDADTGALLKTFNTDASVVGEITVVPDSVTGLIKYAYAADLAGNVYRISGNSSNTAIGSTVPNNWSITKIAALGGSGANNRKFMFSPSVVDDNGTYVLQLGSGDREKPLSSFTAAAAVQNRFYMIQDKPTDATWLSSENATCGSDVLCNNSLFAITSSATPTASELGAKKGWYLDLASSEQVVTSAIVVLNTLTFSTHRPTPPLPNQCSSLGTATVYNLNFRNAATRVGTVRGETIIGGGLSASPVAGRVLLDDGSETNVCFGCDTINNKPKVPYTGGVPVRPKSRIYWKIKK